MGFTITSTAFADGQPIPAKYTGDSADLSPPLAWEGAPKSTVELALICADPDAPNGDFVHWVAYGIPPDMTALKEGVGPTEAGVTQGRNDFGRPGYRGPAPPRGKAHHYHFRLMALDAKTGLGANADKQALRGAVKGHVLAEAELTGTYQR
ncbi:MAG: YbhB/YbcL family Raf kinase inhibitor-like protein [Armatimonadetes bacterium]|nr:YbhB/YbcL family Raf kinase inhibitor-like protein [Armatimonadota bacterium]